MDQRETTLNKTAVFKSLRDCWEYEEPLPAVIEEDCHSDESNTALDHATSSVDLTCICDHCSDEFKDETTLKHHIQLVHSFAHVVLKKIKRQSLWKTSYICNCCSKHFSSRHIMKLHRQKDIYKCDSCFFKCVRKDTLIHHLKEAHVEGAKKNTFQCDYCSRIYSQKHNLINHINIIHMGHCRYKCKVPCEHKRWLTDKSQWRGVLITSKDLIYKYHTYICDNCHKKFSTRKGIWNHLLACASTAPIKCNICSRLCVSQSHLKRHRLMHDPRRRYACKTCKYRFWTMARLKEHVELHERNDKFICEFCHLECVSFRHLNKHRRNHTHSKSRKCDFCDYATQRLDHLDKHIRRHTGEKYKCHLCPFAHIDSYYVRRHIKEKHMMTPNKVTNSYLLTFV